MNQVYNWNNLFVVRRYVQRFKISKRTNKARWGLGDKNWPKRKRMKIIREMWQMISNVFVFENGSILGERERERRCECASVEEKVCVCVCT